MVKTSTLQFKKIAFWVGMAFSIIALLIFSAGISFVNNWADRITVAVIFFTCIAVFFEAIQRIGTFRSARRILRVVAVLFCLFYIIFKISYHNEVALGLRQLGKKVQDEYGFTIKESWFVTGFTDTGSIYVVSKKLESVPFLEQTLGYEIGGEFFCEDYTYKYFPVENALKITCLTRGFSDSLILKN